MARRLTALLLLFLLSAGVRAQGGSARIIVPFAPGGGTDVTARLLAEALTRELGRNFIVENKAGAGGSLGTAEVARSRPDGFTFGMATLSTHGVNPVVYQKLPYDPLKDFAPVAQVVNAPGIMIVTPNLGVSDMAGFLQLVKLRPNDINYASPGNGTIGHLWGELFKQSTQTAMMHIPTKGAAEAMNALLSQQVQVAFDQVASAIPHVRSKRIQALAVSWPRRLPILPEVPTFEELRLDANNEASWFGLVAPARISVETVNRTHAAIVRVLRDPALVARLDNLGLYPSGRGPQDFTRTIQADLQRFGEVARVAGIHLD